MYIVSIAKTFIYVSSDWWLQAFYPRSAHQALVSSIYTSLNRQQAIPLLLYCEDSMMLSFSEKYFSRNMSCQRKVLVIMLLFAATISKVFLCWILTIVCLQRRIDSKPNIQPSISFSKVSVRLLHVWKNTLGKAILEE